MKTIEHLFQSLLRNVQIKDFNLLIERKSFFYMPIKNDGETYEQIIEMGRNNDYMTDNLLDYEYCSKHYKVTAIDLNKQIELESPDLKQQINFIGRLERNEGAIIFSLSKILRKQLFNFHNILQQLLKFLCYI